MIFYPTLKSLKQKLQIQPINTGKQFTHNGQACGIVFDDIERLHAMVGVDGCIHLKVVQSFPWFSIEDKMKILECVKPHSIGANLKKNSF